jgi:hypothetical protein
MGARGPKPRDKSGDTPESRRAWGLARLADERAAAAAKGNHSAKVAALPKVPDPFGPEGSISRAINQKIKATMNQVVASKAPRGARLVADIDSTCLSDLSWKKGVCTATFWRGGNLVYDFPMSKSEFVDFCNGDGSDGSVGRYGNLYVFD